MSDQADAAPRGDEALLREVCKEVRDLLGRVSGPVRRLSVRSGDHRVEIEWEPGAAPSGPPSGAPTTAAGQGAAPVEDDVPGRHVVTAPLVGTFYRSPEPGAAAFVEVGALVEAEQDIAIIEAMKMMNRIPCPVGGRVTAILVEDGTMVEFGQPLMHVDPPDSDG